MISRFFLVIFLCLTISTCAALPRSVDTPQDNFDFNFYSSYLSISLFPEIKACLKSYNKYLNKDEAKNLSLEVYSLIIDNLSKNPIPILSPPIVEVYKLESRRNIAFILQVKLDLLDEEESIGDLVIKLKIRKIFIIFFGEKKIGVGI